MAILPNTTLDGYECTEWPFGQTTKELNTRVTWSSSGVKQNLIEMIKVQLTDHVQEIDLTYHRFNRRRPYNNANGVLCVSFYPNWYSITIKSGRTSVRCPALRARIWYRNNRISIENERMEKEHCPTRTAGFRNRETVRVKNGSLTLFQGEQ